VTLPTYYAVCEEGPDYFNCPTLPFPDGSGVPLFTTKAKAEAFRASNPQLAPFPIVALAGDALLRLLRDCLLGGERYVAWDPGGGRAHCTLILHVLSEVEGSDK
jgi:hypothetical protein